MSYMKNYPNSWLDLDYRSKCLSSDSYRQHKMAMDRMHELDMKELIRKKDQLIIKNKKKLLL